MVLSQKELEILAILSKNGSLTCREISNKIQDIKKSTVSKYLQALKKKNRVEIINNLRAMYKPLWRIKQTKKREKDGIRSHK